MPSGEPATSDVKRLPLPLAAWDLPPTVQLDGRYLFLYNFCLSDDASCLTQLAQIAMFTYVRHCDPETNAAQIMLETC